MASILGLLHPSSPTVLPLSMPYTRNGLRYMTSGPTRSYIFGARKKKFRWN